VSDYTIVCNKQDFKLLCAFLYVLYVVCMLCHVCVVQCIVEFKSSLELVLCLLYMLRQAHNILKSHTYAHILDTQTCRHEK
jgi:hypothetical protein